VDLRLLEHLRGVTRHDSGSPPVARGSPGGPGPPLRARDSGSPVGAGDRRAVVPRRPAETPATSPDHVLGISASERVAGQNPSTRVSERFFRLEIVVESVHGDSVLPEYSWCRKWVHPL
jgi:hypothetical protein